MSQQFILGITCPAPSPLQAGQGKPRKTLTQIVKLIPSAAVMGKTECQCALEGGFIAVRSVNILLTSPPSTARLPLSSLHVVLICLCVRNCQKLDLCPVQLISMN